MTTTCQAAATKSLSDHNREYYQYVQYIPWPTPMHQVSSANRGWIDRISANADVLLEQDWVKVLAEQQTRFLRSQADALGLKAPEAGQEFKLLDYACGQGVSSWVCFFSPSKNLFSSQNKKKKKNQKKIKKESKEKNKKIKNQPAYPTDSTRNHQALLPYVTKIRAIDIAPAMVSSYNRAAAARNLSQDQAHAVEGNLSSSSPPTADSPLSSPEMHSFDAAIVSMALHHMDDPPAILAALAARLRKGGVLIVVEDTDQKPSVGPIEGAEWSSSFPAVLQKTLNKEVFSEDTMRAWFRAAGCRGEGEGFVYVVNDEISPVPESACGVPGGLDRKLLIAASVKE